MFTISQIDINTLVNTISKYDRVDKFLKNNIDMPDDRYKKILEKQERRINEIIWRAKKYELLKQDYVNQKMAEKRRMIAERELRKRFKEGVLDEYIKINKDDNQDDDWFDEWATNTLYQPLS